MPRTGSSCAAGVPDAVGRTTGARRSLEELAGEFEPYAAAIRPGFDRTGHDAGRCDAVRAVPSARS